MAAEDGGSARMVTGSALGLGVLMGASVGLGFGYLGGVVWCGSRPGVVWIEEGGGVVWVTREEKGRRKDKRG